jgi:hypothetical protein
LEGAGAVIGWLTAKDDVVPWVDRKPHCACSRRTEDSVFLARWNTTTWARLWCEAKAGAWVRTCLVRMLLAQLAGRVDVSRVTSQTAAEGLWLASIPRIHCARRPQTLSSCLLAMRHGHLLGQIVLAPTLEQRLRKLDPTSDLDSNSSSLPGFPSSPYTCHETAKIRVSPSRRACYSMGSHHGVTRPIHGGGDSGIPNPANRALLQLLHLGVASVVPRRPCYMTAVSCFDIRY